MTTDEVERWETVPPNWYFYLIYAVIAFCAIGIGWAIARMVTGG